MHLHDMETVMQLAHLVNARAGWYLSVEVSLCNVAGLTGQRDDGFHGLTNDEITEGKH